MSAAGARSFEDHVQPFQIEAPGLRGRLVRLGPAVDAVIAAHQYPPAVAGQLAEAMAMAAVLASGLKYDGIFTLQLQGDGPIRLMVVDMTSSGDMRGYARFEAERLTGPMRTTEGPVPRLFGSAVMSFTVDQGPGSERYQGITPLEGATLSECCHAYFRQSEQLQTAIQLCATDMALPEGGRRAAALMIQRLPLAQGADPEAAEDDWRRAVILMSSARSTELLSPELAPADLLFRLFHEDGVRLFRTRPLRQQCRCSRAKVERALRAFPVDELLAMREDGLLRACCEFCKAEYVFDETALAALGATAADERST
ncbi:MAG: Hsp33 family molecular chaperone HslO [Rhodospirillales bacterium]|nr:Hsp33 family molecular chaperone HslO [Rhodospirillales bacterium]